MRPINDSLDGLSVMAYHAIRNLDGSTTEHNGMVLLTSVGNATNEDGTTNQDVLTLVCPTCGATAYVSILGGEDAQRLHAKVRHARGTVTPYITAAVQSVVTDVTALGGTPRLDPNVG